MQGKGTQGRFPLTEILIAIVGLGCVSYGILQSNVMPLFFGICIVLGSVLLYFVRRKDWDAHWAELDRVRQAHEKRMDEENQKKE